MPYAPFDLTGKVALVTGGSSGIGLGMAEALASAGADIAIWDRDESRAEQARARLAPSGRKVSVRAVDVSMEEAVVEAARATVEEFGRLDAVFANAGFGWRTPFLELRAEDYRRVVGTSLDGAVWTLRETVRHMVDRAKAGDPGGSVVVTASTAATEGAYRSQSYAAAKGGVISVVKAVAVEFARYGVRANSILPGWTKTAIMDEERFGSLIDTRVPMKRWGTPADFGGLAVYLASDASSFHTGDSLVVDGGYTIF
ncbi:SDR family NAD(P)-dependent oxidoreductase [Pseudonocardia sp. RS010]|uniref:SDR family NAD(P)-dependent oxidoreductase n=1 Tax=Pseudonocardia sp. RS010 TaxID=3385979 RepID=UPI0039A250F6